MSTHDILSPFKAWGNCSIQDIKLNSKRSRAKHYFPMDASSLAKTSDMPAVGALYPRKYAERGYWWWKAQEITYALRPKPETLESLHSKYGNMLGNMAAFQIRRTDKTKGCAEVYGMFCNSLEKRTYQYLHSFIGSKSAIKCKKEANAPRLSDFVHSLKRVVVSSPQLIQIITDDAEIFDEIALNSEEGLTFLPPEPAPKRVPDKVNLFLLLLLFLNLNVSTLVRKGRRFQVQGAKRCPRYTDDVIWKSTHIYIQQRVWCLSIASQASSR